MKTGKTGKTEKTWTVEVVREVVRPEYGVVRGVVAESAAEAMRVVRDGVVERLRVVEWLPDSGEIWRVGGLAATFATEEEDD